MKTLACVLLAAAVPFALTGCGGSSSDGSSAGHTAPIGTWGGSLVSDATMPAALTLTASGGHFAFYCGQTADISQAIVPDSSGHFSAAGTVTFGFVPNPPHEPAQFIGTVTNHVMTVTLNVTPAAGTPYSDGPYTVTLGQAAPTFQGACPG